jgi:hypothetical protein
MSNLFLRINRLPTYGPTYLPTCLKYELNGLGSHYNEIHH